MAKTSIIQMRNAVHDAGKELSASGNSFTTMNVQDVVEKLMHVRPGQQFTEGVLAEKFQVVNVVESRWIFPPRSKSVEN